MLCSMLTFRRILPAKVSGGRRKIILNILFENTVAHCVFNNRFILCFQTFQTLSVHRSLGHHFSLSFPVEGAELCESLGPQLAAQLGFSQFVVYILLTFCHQCWSVQLATCPCPSAPPSLCLSQLSGMEVSSSPPSSLTDDCPEVVLPKGKRLLMREEVSYI